MNIYQFNYFAIYLCLAPKNFLLKDDYFFTEFGSDYNRLVEILTYSYRNFQVSNSVYFQNDFQCRHIIFKFICWSMARFCNKYESKEFFGNERSVKNMIYI